MSLLTDGWAGEKEGKSVMVAVVRRKQQQPSTGAPFLSEPGRSMTFNVLVRSFRRPQRVLVLASHAFHCHDCLTRRCNKEHDSPPSLLCALQLTCTQVAGNTANKTIKVHGRLEVKLSLDDYHPESTPHLHSPSRSPALIHGARWPVHKAESFNLQSAANRAAALQHVWFFHNTHCPSKHPWAETTTPSHDIPSLHQRGCRLVAPYTSQCRVLRRPRASDRSPWTTCYLFHPRILLFGAWDRSSD